MRVLVYSKDKKSCNAAEMRLTSAKFNVTATTGYEDAVELSKVYDFDVIIVDTDVFQMTKQLRNAQVKIPIIAVCPPELLDGEERALLLNAGADACLVGPVDPREFVATVLAVVRRSHNHAVNVIDCGGLAVNMDKMQISIRGEIADFTSTEYRLLQLLAVRMGSTVTREMLMNHLYGGIDEPADKIIDVFICKLRRKLKRHGLGGLIATVWGRGYQIYEAAK